MPHSSLSSIVRRLWLRHIDNSTRHASNKDHCSWRLTFHQVFCNTNGKEVCSIHVDAPELADTVDWVVDSWEVLGETGGCDEVVNLAMLRDDLCDASVD